MQDNGSWFLDIVLDQDSDTVLVSIQIHTGFRFIIQRLGLDNISPSCCQPTHLAMVLVPVSVQ